MAEEDSAPEVDVDQVARIVSSYVQHHQIAPDQLITLIVNVHRALAGLGRSPPVQEPLRPAVPIRRSVQHDYVVCLECGFRAQALRRHLRVAHGLEVAQVSGPLEFTSGSPDHGTGLFAAPIGTSEGARPRPPACPG